jgi:lysophospholipase L1-like esterase
VDESPQRILILGDSMIDGLLPPLADYAVENGHSVNAVIWYGSRTIDWARGSRLSDALRDYRPTFVIFVVGSSELTTRDVEKRASAVKTMLKLVGDRKLVWIGPPNWRRDTGLGALLEREVGAGRYFRSLELSFERKRDGIHPTLASSKRWMDAVAEWITGRSAVPIRMALPQKTGTPRPNARVFAPPAP